MLFRSDSTRIHRKYSLSLQDGEIVLKDSTRPEGERVRWRISGTHLSLEDDGRLVSRDSSENVVWSSDNRGLYPHDTFTFDYIVTVAEKFNSQLHRTNGKYCVGSALTTDMRLNVNEYLASPNGEFIAVMQSDGNFVVYNKERYLWATGTAGSVHEE